VNQNKSLANRALVRTILENIFDIQGAFITLLADPKSLQIQRESCCLGLAACRSISTLLSDDDSHKRDELDTHLLRAFGQTTNFGSSAMIETSEQASERRRAEGREGGQSSESAEAAGPRSEVGGAAGMSEAALGAYREMATASVSLGRSDILYALLIMSVSHSIWFLEGYRDRYNAASLLGENSFLGNRTNIAEMREALKPHLGKLVPRLLRACHDPNKQTREQMVFLWNGITGGGSEARSIVTKHFLTTFDALVKDASSKLWRARVGACGALAEIIVGRDWNDLGGGGAVLDDDDIHISSNVSAGTRLLRLWRVSSRAIDDIRDAVRESGERLGRATRALTLRLCDPSLVDASGSKRSREEQVQSKQSSSAAAATSLRWLIKHGLNQQCPEATGLCLSALVEVVGAVSPTMLSPILGDLLHSLLLAMSGMEPAALNYLQLRTNDQEGLERARLQLSQAGPLASAVNKCLEAVPGVTIEAQKSIVSRLDSALRLSAGFATRAATADATSQLCSSCPAAFKFSGVSGTANPSVQLMRALYFAMEREQGQATKDKLCHAFGNIAALCPGKSVRSLAAKACKRYNTSCGNNYDPASRRASALALRAIAVRASDQFADGGPSEIWLRIVLPAAYLGQKDSDEKIASLWTEVWEEGGSVASTSNRLMYSRLEEKILPELVGQCCTALQDVAWSRRVAAASSLGDLSSVMAPSNIFSHSVRRAEAASQAINGCLHLLVRPRLWLGKSKVVAALVALVASWSVDTKLEWTDDDFTLPVDMASNQTDLFSEDAYFTKSDIDQTFAVEMDVEYNEPSAPDGAMDNTISDVENEEDDKMESMEENAVSKISQPVVLEGVCRWLVAEALTKGGSDSLSDELLPYRQGCLKGFCRLHDRRPSLFAILSPIVSKSLQDDKETPVIVARILDCLGQCWYDRFDKVDEWKSLLTVTPVQAWTVRVATCDCAGQLVEKVDTLELRKHSFVSWTMENVKQAVRDSKYWKSRQAGLVLLEGLVNRANSDVTILEAVLPHKEDMMKLLRKCLADSQHQVTAKSSTILQNASQWP
jgi:proteasome component ECM29